MKIGFIVLAVFLFILSLLFAMGCGGPLTTREKGGLIGAGAGAGLGAIIGNQVGRGHPGAGAAIGGLLGLGAGALIGDQLQARDNEINNRQQELEHQRRLRENAERSRQLQQGPVSPNRLPPHQTLSQTPRSRIDPRALVGLNETEAMNQLTKSGYLFRIIRRGDKHYPDPMDYRGDRMLLELDQDGPVWTVSEAHIR